MERQKKVVDASIVVKWFVKEENSNKALELRNDHKENKHQLIVPGFCFLEVINALRYNKNKISSEDLKCINELLWNYSQFRRIYDINSRN